MKNQIRNVMSLFRGAVASVHFNFALWCVALGAFLAGMPAAADIDAQVLTRDIQVFHCPDSASGAVHPFDTSLTACTGNDVRVLDRTSHTNGNSSCGECIGRDENSRRDHFTTTGNLVTRTQNFPSNCPTAECAVMPDDVGLFNFVRPLPDGTTMTVTYYHVDSFVVNVQAQNGPTDVIFFWRSNEDFCTEWLRGTWAAGGTGEINGTCTCPSATASHPGTTSDPIHGVCKDNDWEEERGGNQAQWTRFWYQNQWMSCAAGQFLDDLGRCQDAQSGAECVRANGIADSTTGEVVSVYIGGMYSGNTFQHCISECPNGMGAFPDATDATMIACRAPTDSNECFRINPVEPIFVSGGDCQGAVSHDQCRMAFPNRPIMEESGLCRAAINNAECAGAHASLRFRLQDGSCAASAGTLLAAPLSRTPGEVEAGHGSLVGTAVAGLGYTAAGAANPEVPAQEEADSRDIAEYLPFAALAGSFMFSHLYPDYSVVPSFGFSGENENVRWESGLRGEFAHGRFSSFVYASHSSSDDWIVVESGTEYGGDLFTAAYKALESKERLAYDFHASSPQEFGLWTIAPTAAAEFQYQREDDEWSSESSAGLTAAWTAHRWKVSAQSNFTSNTRHALDLELQF